MKFQHCNLTAAALLMALGSVSAIAATDVAVLAGGNANKLVALQFLELSAEPAKRLEAVAKYCAPGYVNYRESKAERGGAAAIATPNAEARPAAGAQGGPQSGPAAAPSVTQYLRVLADGEYVSVFYTRTGGPAAGKPITNFMGRQGGPQIANMAVDVLHIVKGKITEKWTIVEAIDTLDMVQ